ncbi:MAG: hypothetical protein AAF541_08450 [Pseudomonadota bacterium]
MTWVIIALVLIVAVGPVLYLLPSAKDKRLMNLRQAARQQGLGVRMTCVPNLAPELSERVNAAGERLDPSINCVAYERPIRANLPPLKDLQLLKVPDNPTIPIVPAIEGWAYGQANPGREQVGDEPQDSGGGSAGGAGADVLGDPDLESQLLALIARFPSDTLAVEINNKYIACLWLERSTAESEVVDQISSIGEQLEALLNRHMNG